MKHSEGLSTDTQWSAIGRFSHHGISVPLFSLCNPNNCGIGEFLDLLPLIDWCKKVGFDVIQLLPINDTGEDPSPYNPLSSCALDPIYLSLFELLKIDIPKLSNRLEILEFKEKSLFVLFEKDYKILSKTLLFEQFLKEHPWVHAYAQFKSFQHVPEFHLFLQFHAFRQMAKVKQYAETKGIKIKGDLPILLSRNSADLLQFPHLFHLEFDAGAPPDFYNPKGQNWGFPIFNWEAMQKDQFRWWKMRLKSVEKLYHIYRIDHVVGLFRLWGIPKGKPAITGSYFPEDPALWEGRGRSLLEMMIGASPLLPIAEDLGTIPKETYSVLKQLGICGTKVMRWENVEGKFTPLDHYDALSMTTLGTHDMEPLELWWEKHPNEAAPFAEFLHLNYKGNLGFGERQVILRAAHHTSSLFHINPLQEYLALIPEFTSKNPEEERINQPGTTFSSNWSYRFRVTTEEFIQSEPLTQAIRSIIDTNPNQ